MLALVERELMINYSPSFGFLQDRKMEDLLNQRKQPEDVRRTLTDRKGDTSAVGIGNNVILNGLCIVVSAVILTTFSI